MEVNGRCHCGRITYRATVDPELVGICHCTDCQVLSGTAYRVRLPVPTEHFHLLTGQPRTYIKTADSGAKRLHAFCADCGSPVYASAVERPPTITLRVGCLDRARELPPRSQIWCRSSLDWAMNLEPLPGVSQQQPA